ncbi:Phospholipase B [Spironucleus salmonicida]|uniref:Phospholipase B-like n=1 Tax=Spironucleus salmonicida TaxID=348837 RepID=V6LCA6_9EUKA|nr:Phospholipase B [Spironucleus salmonicida]|eukprot:EST41868.1 Phospholipase B [Spironucleus salmonicida]
MLFLAFAKLQRYCVYREPLDVKPCKVNAFNDNIGVILDVDLELNSTGWMTFKSNSNPELPARYQSYYVGYAEGKLFQHHIWNHHMNVKDWFLHSYLPFPDFPEELNTFFRQNLAWTRSNIGKFARDRFWKEVGNTMYHFDGMVLGYQQACSKAEYMSELDLYIYVSSGDLLDVVEFALPTMRPNWKNMTQEMKETWAQMRDHCSGLVRVSNDTIYLSQTAWFFYGSMTRVWKEYEFNYSSSAASKISFSSYPGFSYSFDDFYATDSGIMFFETTNNIYNTDLYNLCSPKSVLTWIRSQVAGRAAKTAPDFIQLIRRFNSGTYNNQWVVVDLNKFKEKAEKDVMWVLEQVPGRTAAYDGTEQLLKDGYFGSFNIPSLKNVRKVSGYEPMAEADPSDDYDATPRNLIFQRDAPKVDSLEKMQHLMRYNDYLHDALSLDMQGNPEPGFAISSRYDQRPGDRAKCFGGFDNKIGMFNRRTGEYLALIVSSPTNQTESAPLWAFKGDMYCPRRGLPDGPYNYPSITVPLELKLRKQPE